MHELDLCNQRRVLRRDEICRLENGVVVEALGHEAVVPARRRHHGNQKVGADEQKPLRDLGLAWLKANWLFGAVVDVVDVARDQRVGEFEYRLGDVPRGLHGAHVQIPEALVPVVLVRMAQALVPYVCSPPTTW